MRFAYFFYLQDIWYVFAYLVSLLKARENKLFSSPGILFSSLVNSPSRPRILVSVPQAKEDWIVHPWNVLIPFLTHPEQSLQVVQHSALLFSSGAVLPDSQGESKAAS